MMERLRESRGFYILLSILLALAFWMYVRVVEDPTQDGVIYGVPVTLSGERTLEEQGLTVASLSQNTVDVKVNAPVSVLDNLNRNNLTVTLDVSRCTQTGEYELTPTFRLPTNVDTSGAFFPTDQSTQSVTVTVDTLATKTVAVEFQLEGSVAEGYQAGTAVIEPETVELSGTQAQVSQVQRVVAILQADDLDQSYSGSLPLTMLDSAGEPITGSNVRLSVDSVYVTLTVGVVKTVPLTVSFTAGGGATQANVKYEIEPKTITVVGSQEELAGLTQVSLGSIDLSQVIGTATITKPIELSPTLENAEGVSEATVTVTVEGLETKSLDVTNIETVNVPEGYSVELVTRTRTVVVRGTASALEDLDASQARIQADLSSITATGINTVNATVYLNATSEVGAIGTYTIVVNISRD